MTTSIPSVEDLHRTAWGPTRRYEARLLNFLCAHTPDYISSDHFTLLSVLSYVLNLACMAAVRRARLFIFLSIVFLVTQWLGDSMDGSLARYRHRQRPRYGLLLDHSIDAAFIPLVVLGYSLAGILSWTVTVPSALMASWTMFYMEQIDRIEQKRMMALVSLGHTEFRIMLAALNVYWFLFPSARIGGRSAYNTVLGALVVCTVFLLLIVFLRDCRRLRCEDEQALNRKGQSL